MTLQNVEKTKRILGSLFWGAMIGGSLGILESFIFIRLWIAFGSPYFLIKPGHPGEFGLIEITLTGGGIIVGLIFGIVVGIMALKRQINVRYFPLYLSLLLLGAVIYALAYTLTLRFHSLPLILVCDPFLFFIGLRLARVLSLKSDLL